MTQSKESITCTPTPRAICHSTDGHKVHHHARRAIERAVTRTTIPHGGTLYYSDLNYGFHLEVRPVRVVRGPVHVLRSVGTAGGKWRGCPEGMRQACGRMIKNKRKAPYIQVVASKKNRGRKGRSTKCESSTTTLKVFQHTHHRNFCNAHTHASAFGPHDNYSRAWKA